MTIISKKSLALLGLALDEKKPSGNKPSLLEIDLWRRGKLNKKRSAEVQAFVTHDSECYQLWMDLLESEQLLAAEKAKNHISLSQRLKSWLPEFNANGMGGGLAFATASVLIAVVTLKTVMQPDLLTQIDGDYAQFTGEPALESWYYRMNDKSLDFSLPSTYDLLKPAILKGLGEGLRQLQQAGKLANNTQWQQVISAYPSDFPDCPQDLSAEVCQQQQVLLQTFGRNMALLQLSCAQTDLQASAEFYPKQAQRLAEFKQQFSAYENLAPLTEQLNNWQPAEDKVVFCQQVKQLLNSIDH